MKIIRGTNVAQYEKCNTRRFPSIVKAIKD
jgi:hypothetical protein